MIWPEAVAVGRDPPPGAVYPPAAFRKLLELPAAVRDTPLTDRPVTAVVVLLPAIGVAPSVIGKPAPPPLPQTTYVPAALKQFVARPSAVSGTLLKDVAFRLSAGVTGFPAELERVEPLNRQISVSAALVWQRPMRDTG